jgi:hypothetical protein
VLCSCACRERRVLQLPEPQHSTVPERWLRSSCATNAHAAHHRYCRCNDALTVGRTSARPHARALLIEARKRSLFRLFIHNDHSQVRLGRKIDTENSTSAPFPYSYTSFDDHEPPIRPTQEWPCGASLVRNAPDLILPWPDDDDDQNGGGGLTWAGYEGTWREKGATFRSVEEAAAAARL